MRCTGLIALPNGAIPYERILSRVKPVRLEACLTGSYIATAKTLLGREYHLGGPIRIGRVGTIDDQVTLRALRGRS